MMGLTARKPVGVLRVRCCSRRTACQTARSRAVSAGFAGAFVLLLLLLPVRTDAVALELPRAEITVGGHAFTVEIAATPRHRSRGLMYRSGLPLRHGMLFVFPDTDYRAFWMANTAIPLTLAYIDEDGLIIEFHDLKPFSRASVPSSEPVRYALEVNRGELAALGVELGDRVELPGDLPQAQ